MDEVTTHVGDVTTSRMHEDVQATRDSGFNNCMVFSGLVT